MFSWMRRLFGMDMPQQSDDDKRHGLDGDLLDKIREGAADLPLVVYPQIHYSADGDCIEVILQATGWYGEQVCKHLSLHRSRSDNEIVGFSIDGIAAIMKMPPPSRFRLTSRQKADSAKVVKSDLPCPAAQVYSIEINGNRLLSSTPSRAEIEIDAMIVNEAIEEERRKVLDQYRATLVEIIGS